MDTNDKVDAIPVFIKYFRRRSTSEQSIKNYEKCLQRFEISLGKPLVDARASDLDDLISRFEARTPETAPVKVSTLRTYIRILRAFFAFALEYGYIQRNPMAIVRAPRPEQRAPTYFTERQIRLLLSAPIRTRPTGMRLHALLATLYGCGLRANEALALDVDDVGLDRMQILVRHAKGGKVRGVPFGPELRDSLVAWLEMRPALALASETALFVGRDGERLEYGAARLQIKWAYESVGLDGTAHWLRHSAATHLMQHGANIRECQEFLGHEHVTTTQIYTHVAPEQLRRMPDLLPGLRKAG